MPVVTCPKCPTKLKIPDGVRGNTKCPKCGTVFPVNQPAPAAAFEVVDEKPASKPAVADFEVVDEKPKKRADDDDDDEPKKKKKKDVDDDDDDDEPKSKKKKKKRDDDDDDDDDDDRPKKKKKKKKKRDYDDDDDDEWAARPPSGKRKAFANAKTGAKLLSISFWLNLGAYGLLALYILIAWIMLLAATNSTPSTRSGGGSSGGSGDGIDARSVLDLIAMLPGLVGLGAWIVGLVGCGFAIAGPARARGMAITTTVFSGVHLLLLGITFDNLLGGMGGARALPGIGKVAWVAVASILPIENTLLPVLVSKDLRPALEQWSYLIALAAGICEALRLIFALQTLRATADAAGDGYAADKATAGARLVYVILGVMPIIVFVMGLIIGSLKGTGAFHLLFLMMLLMYGAYAFMMLNPAMAAMQTKDACDSRT